jgi:oligopeptide transport system substrate-binding protein
MEHGMFLNRLDGEPPPMYFHGWLADYPDPDNFLRAGFPWHETGWRNEVYDRLVRKASQVIDQGERMKLYGQAEGILVDEAAIMPLYYGRSHLLVKPWVSNLLMSATATRFWKNVIIEPH